jgi:menaquinone-dependent protoporphyrinogen oxidase
MNSLVLFFGLKSADVQKVQELPITGTAIVYMSKHGTTEKVSLLIKELMKEEDVTLINLDKQIIPDLSQCTRVIIGGSIHIGKIQKQIQLFCQKNNAILKSKPLGLFLCCMYDGDKANEQFNNAFPEEIRAVARSKALMGFELQFDRMNMIDRTITKKITGYSESTSQINQNELKRFIMELKQ